MTSGKGEADDPLELSFLGLKIRIPVGFITRTFFPGFVARSDAIRALASSATDKIAAGPRLSDEEQTIFNLVVRPVFEKTNRAARIAGRADEILEAETKQLPARSAQAAEPKPPSEPWQDRWVAGAELSSSEDVEEMWARILAGEFASPGSFSFKTLTVLRDIDTETAEIFVKLLGFALDGWAVPMWQKFTAAYDQLGIPYLWFLRLSEIGLVNFADSTMQRPLPAPQFHVVGGGLTWRISGNDQLLPIHALTRAGQELGRISLGEPRIDCCKALGNWLQSMYPSVEVALPVGEGFHVWRPDLFVQDSEGLLRF